MVAWTRRSPAGAPNRFCRETRAVKDGADGIALNIIDPEGFDEVVQAAVDAGVPVVAVEEHAERASVFLTSMVEEAAVVEAIHA